MSSTTSAALAPTSTVAPTAAPPTPAEANPETELGLRGQTELGSPPAPPPTGVSRAASGGLVARPVPYRFSGRELLLAVRPHQWVKNALVMIVPILTGLVLHPASLVATLIATIAFCAASATTYLLNDLADIDADKLHPTKQLRPIASGTLSVSDARAATVIIGTVAFGLAVELGWPFVVLLTGYLAMTTAYSNRLKHIPVVDVITLAAGFVLRVGAGAVAVKSGVSIWLLAAVAAGAVLISLGKRHAEVGRLGVDASEHRAVLDWYQPARTRPMMIASEIVAVGAVGVWFNTTFGLTVAIVATAIVATILERFRRLVLAGHVDDPVRVISHDRPIAAASLVLGVLMIASVIL